MKTRDGKGGDEKMAERGMVRWRQQHLVYFFVIVIDVVVVIVVIVSAVLPSITVTVDIVPVFRLLFCVILSFCFYYFPFLFLSLFCLVIYIF